MRRLLVLLMFAAFSSTATAGCVIESLDNMIRGSKVVFLATITDAKLANSTSHLEHGKPYSINYSFKIQDRVKGNPATARRLFSFAIYNASDASTRVEAAEEIRLFPGDTVLIISNGESSVKIGYCTASRKWDRTTKELDVFRSRPAL